MNRPLIDKKKSPKDHFTYITSRLALKLFGSNTIPSQSTPVTDSPSSSANTVEEFWERCFLQKKKEKKEKRKKIVLAE